MPAGAFRRRSEAMAGQVSLPGSRRLFSVPTLRETGTASENPNGPGLAAWFGMAATSHLILGHWPLLPPGTDES